ncbi:MAG: hypothetical protein ACPG59_00710, partial [Flavobacteriaceae bacterium]
MRFITPSRLPVLFFLVLFPLAQVFAQGGTCSSIEPFCAGNQALIFANCNNADPDCVTTAETGPDYGCLGLEPYPAWFYLQIDESGNLNFTITQNTSFDTNGNPTGTGLDVDFICWGPFAQGADLCDYSQLQSQNEVACSYSAAPVENFSINGAQSGEIYVLVITNFNQSPGFIKLEQTNAGQQGAGSTDCSILANETACDGDTITFDATTTGAVAYDWTYESPAGSGNYIPFVPAETNPTLDVTVSGSYRCEVTLTSALEFQETFNTGTGLECNLNGATTTYACYSGGGMEDGEYVVSNDSAGLNGGWHPTMEDHTVGDTNGRMLFVNADIPVGEFYRRTISLDPNTDYSFSAWISTVYDTDSGICGGNSVPSNVRFRIENMAGGTIQETVTGNIPNGSDPDWQEYFISFNTGPNTDIQLVLINNAPGGCGNDLVIDDISLSQVNNTPEILFFEAIFLPQPVVETAPDDLFICNNNGLTLGIFDLTQNEAQVIGTQDPAELNVFYTDGAGNPIADPTAHTITGTSETITIRIEELTGLCFAEATFEIVYTTVLAGVVDDLVVCDSDGNGSEPIDLVAEFDAQVLNGQPAGDFTISYHSTQAEANAGTNALTSPYNVATPFENIFVRFTSTIDPNCSDTNQNFIISVASPPIFEAAPLDLTQCSADVTIPGIFDLTVNEPIVIGTQDPANIVVTYYDSLGSLIAFPGAYTISGVSEVITMRLDNILGNCFNEATFVLTYTQALSGDVEDYNLCDLDGNGDEPINLSVTFDSQVLDGQPLGDYFITYHSSQLDADLSQNALPTPYVVNGPSEQIYVRLENRQDPSCFDTAENFTIFLIPPPTPGLIDPFVVCDSDND